MASEHDSPFLVVGLGNPGTKYDRTRHNLGFRVVDGLVRRWSADGPRSAFQAHVWDARLHGPQDQALRVLLLQPQTYMNLSGRSVQEAARFHRIAPERVLVVMDDMALPVGQLRFREQGSAGGHNGLADILRALGTDAIPRLRIGIGTPPPRIEGVDYVLMRFSSDEEPVIESALPHAVLAVEQWATHGIRFVMDRYNRKVDSQQTQENGSSHD